MPQASPSGSELTVLYDGDCAFCSWTVRQLRMMDRHGRLRFLPLQLVADPRRGGRLATLTKGLPLQARLHVVDAADRVASGGRAMLEILDRLPGGWLFDGWSRLPGVGWLAERAYEAAARNRALLARLVRAEEGWSCRLPEPSHPGQPQPPAGRSRTAS